MVGMPRPPIGFSIEPTNPLESTAPDPNAPPPLARPWALCLNWWGYLALKFGAIPAPVPTPPKRLNGPDELSRRWLCEFGFEWRAFCVLRMETGSYMDYRRGWGNRKRNRIEGLDSADKRWSRWHNNLQQLVTYVVLFLVNICKLKLLNVKPYIYDLEFCWFKLFHYEPMKSVR